jgi:hypothetical protein
VSCMRAGDGRPCRNDLLAGRFFQSQFPTLDSGPLLRERSIAGQINKR